MYDDFVYTISKDMPRWPISLSSSTTAAACSSRSMQAPKKQLTRCRKLRHLQDHQVTELDFSFLESPATDTRFQVQATAEADGSYDAKQSPVNSDCSDNLARLSTAVPQPLPLPDLKALFISNDRKKENDFVFRLPSPKGGAKERQRVREREKGKENSSKVSGRDGFSSSFPCDSETSEQDARSGNGQSGVDLVEIWLSRNMTQSADKAQGNFDLQVPCRSAPASGYSSPILSPERLTTGDLFSTYHMAYQVQFSPEISSKVLTFGLPHTIMQEKANCEGDCSPVRNPGLGSPYRPRNSASNPASRMCPKLSIGLPHTIMQEKANCEGDCPPIQTSGLRSPYRPRNSASNPSSRIYPKLSIDTSTVHIGSNSPQSGHPLPRPPGPATPFQSSPAPQMSAQSSPLSQISSSSSSPHPQNSAQASPHSQNSVQSLPASKMSPKPEFSHHKSQWNKGKLIGRGTFGSVYVATNRATGALCAMKEVEICHDDPKSVECMKQLQQEIKVLSNLKHPNIVQYYGSQIVNDRFYIYLEYVYPGSIHKYVREHVGAMTELVVRNFTRHILSGLAYLHSTKTIHRDIKGANLLVDSSGVVKLADFGTAKHLTGQSAELSLKGSPYWMAPELMQAVIHKDSSSDHAFAIDIWSLGCTVIEMFTGKPPWNEYEGAAAMFKVLKESPPIPEALSAEGKDFLQCCFQRNPAKRPSASMLLEHQFVRKSKQPDVPYCHPTSKRLHIMDKTFSARELPAWKLDQMLQKDSKGRACKISSFTT